MTPIFAWKLTALQQNREWRTSPMLTDIHLFLQIDHCSLIYWAASIWLELFWVHKIEYWMKWTEFLLWECIAIVRRLRDNIYRNLILFKSTLHPKRRRWSWEGNAVSDTFHSSLCLSFSSTFAGYLLPFWCQPDWKTISIFTSELLWRAHWLPVRLPEAVRQIWSSEKVLSLFQWEGAWRTHPHPVKASAVPPEGYLAWSSHRSPLLSKVLAAETNPRQQWPFRGHLSFKGSSGTRPIPCLYPAKALNLGLASVPHTHMALGSLAQCSWL